MSLLFGEGDPLVPVLVVLAGAVAVAALASLGLIPGGVGTALFGYYLVWTVALIWVGLMEIVWGFTHAR